MIKFLLKMFRKNKRLNKMNHNLKVINDLYYNI